MSVARVGRYAWWSLWGFSFGPSGAVCCPWGGPEDPWRALGRRWRVLGWFLDAPGVPGAFPGGVWGFLVRPQASLECPRGVLGVLGRSLGGLWGVLGAPLGGSWGACRSLGGPVVSSGVHGGLGSGHFLLCWRRICFRCKELLTLFVFSQFVRSSDVLYALLFVGRFCGRLFANHQGECKAKNNVLLTIPELTFLEMHITKITKNTFRRWTLGPWLINFEVFVFVG